jgi:serine/threonine protein kinase
MILCFFLKRKSKTKEKRLTQWNTAPPLFLISSWFRVEFGIAVARRNESNFFCSLLLVFYLAGLGGLKCFRRRCEFRLVAAKSLLYHKGFDGTDNQNADFGNRRVCRLEHRLPFSFPIKTVVVTQEDREVGITQSENRKGIFFETNQLKSILRYFSICQESVRSPTMLFGSKQRGYWPKPTARSPAGRISRSPSFLALVLGLFIAVALGDKDWVRFPPLLNVPRSISSIVFYNNTFLIVGGCEDPYCQVLSRAMTSFNEPSTELVELSPAPTFVELNGHRIEVGVAGYYSSVTVGQFQLLKDEVMTQVWIVGACSMHFRRTMDTVERLKFRSLWALSHDLSQMDRYVLTDEPVPLRVNASCVTFGANIYIVGGVLFDNLTLTSSIDVFNVQTGTYVHNLFSHTVAVMNAAVTIDNLMMYIAGGQTTVYEGTNPQGVISVSNVVRGYKWPPFFLLNETLPLLQVVHFPDNGYLRGDMDGGQTLPRVFAFAGMIVMIDSTEGCSILDVTGSADTLANLSWVQDRSGGTRSQLSTIVGFPQLNSFEGTRFTLYSFGGVGVGDGKGVGSESSFSSSSSAASQPHGDNSTAANTDVVLNTVATIWFRFTSLKIPGPSPTVPLATPTGVPYTVNLEPFIHGNWFARLSPDIACYLNGDFTQDIPVSSDFVATFVPELPNPRMFLCVGRKGAAAEIVNETFFAVSNPYAAIAVLPHFHSFAPPTPQPSAGPSNSIGSGESSDKGTIIFAAVLGFLVVAGIIGATVAFQRAKRIQAALEDGLLDDDIDEKTDSLVRNTTSDSRYKVLRRIGAGSFSTVFLVARKTDGEQFALKFMACADDRERLDAIKECETINSLQGHPNVITLYDMFMSYEFERRDSTLSDDVAASERMVAVHRESTLDQGRDYGTLGGSPTTPKAGGLRGRQRSDSMGSRSSSTGSTGLPVHTRYLCLVMEYHPAGDLAHWVLDASCREEGRGMPEVAIISVAYQLCSVLKHLHGQRPPVVHRDLKPENVLLRGCPTHRDNFLPIVVTDFGLAFIQEENRKGGKGGGTRPYIAPECWRGNVSTASDIWSLGCVLYAIATQRVTADTVRVMFLDAKSPHFHEDIQYDLRVHRYSEKFARFVASLLIVDPKQRPTAADLLQRFSAGQGPAASPVHLQ